MNPARRRLLQTGASLCAAGAVGAPLLAAPASDSAGTSRSQSEERRVGLRNLHTGERLDVEYYRAGYVPDALRAIRTVLRDFRTDQQHDIDPKLLDYLVDVARQSGVDPLFDVISGYRSPQTNAELRERSSGVAEHSLHMEGRAIDVRHATIDCAALAGRALELRRGGVGYYRKSNFVHLDTGAPRTWKG